VYTKPVFQWRKALCTSTDGKTLYDFAARGLLRLDALHRSLRNQVVALSHDRILNLSEVEQAMPQASEPAKPKPAARERQILGYHKKHKGTSPPYEQTRAKYPRW
jgi:hypothetical protein